MVTTKNYEDLHLWTLKGIEIKREKERWRVSIWVPKKYLLDGHMDEKTAFWGEDTLWGLGIIRGPRTSGLGIVPERARERL